jgi:hypothetical protein
MTSQETLARRSRFVCCGRWQAVAITAAWLAITGWCVVIASTQAIIPKAPREHAAKTTGDADFYRAVIGRVHAGQDYYAAVATELHGRGYEPHSVFNWRPPLYAWLFGKFPGPVASIFLLGLLALVTVAFTFRALRQSGGLGKAVGAMLLLIGPLAWCSFADVSLFSELWAGILITLSVASLALEHRKLGWLAALLALGFRELALPYYVLAGVYDCRPWRWRTVLRWLVGLLVYAAIMSWHVARASQYLTGASVIHGDSWVQFGGTAFVLLTAQVNFFLILAPSVVTAIYLPLSLLGLLAWRGRGSGLAAMTVVVYIAAFMVIGMRPQNAYWGLLYAPLLPLGLVWAPTALADLWRALTRRCANMSHEDGEPARSELAWHRPTARDSLKHHQSG